MVYLESATFTAYIYTVAFEPTKNYIYGIYIGPIAKIVRLDRATGNILNEISFLNSLLVHLNTFELRYWLPTQDGKVMIHTITFGSTES